MAKLRPISVANYRVVVEGTPTYWEKFSGFDENRGTFTFTDGLSNEIQEYPTGMRSKSQLTLTKSFDPRQDYALDDLFERFCNVDGITITVEPIQNCSTGERIGTRTETYTGCQLIGQRGGDVDRQGNGTSMREWKFTYERRTAA